MRTVDASGTETKGGEWVQNVALADENSVPTRMLNEDGKVAFGAPGTLKVGTLSFISRRGDRYPYPYRAIGPIPDLGIGAQAALSRFLTENFPARNGKISEVEPNAFSAVDTEKALTQVSRTSGSAKTRSRRAR